MEVLFSAAQLDQDKGTLSFQEFTACMQLCLNAVLRSGQVLSNPKGVAALRGLVSSPRTERPKSPRKAEQRPTKAREPSPKKEREPEPELESFQELSLPPQDLSLEPESEPDIEPEPMSLLGEKLPISVSVPLASSSVSLSPTKVSRSAAHEGRHSGPVELKEIHHVPNKKQVSGPGYVPLSSSEVDDILGLERRAKTVSSGDVQLEAERIAAKMIEKVQNEAEKRDAVARCRIEELERRLAESESEVELLNIKLGVVSQLDQERVDLHDNWGVQRTATEVKQTLKDVERGQLDYMTRTKLLENDMLISDKDLSLEEDKSEEVSNVVRGIMETWLQKSCNEAAYIPDQHRDIFPVSPNGKATDRHSRNGARITKQARMAMMEAEQILAELA